jgi:hypothetical protein
MRVLVVVNKWWECDPVMNVLLHAQATPPLPWPTTLNQPHRRCNPKVPGKPNPSPQPRAIFPLSPRTSVEVWCISDLLEHLPDTPQYQSSSRQKMEVLPAILAGGPPALVIAVGTAATPTGTSLNGSVVIGTQIFMHDAYPLGSNPDSPWDSPWLDHPIPFALTATQFRTLTAISEPVEPRLLPAPLNAASHRLVCATYNAVAVASVNVTDSDDYTWADSESLAAQLGADVRNPPGSVETTHGLIRVIADDAPFLFVSGITDRVGYFSSEVGARPYSQSFAAAHNAGVAVAWMLPKIDSLTLTG